MFKTFLMSAIAMLVLVGLSSLGTTGCGSTAASAPVTVIKVATPSADCTIPVGFDLTTNGYPTFAGGFINSYAVTVNAAVTVVDISFLVGTPAASSIGMAIYASNGASTAPATLIASGSLTGVVNGYNNLPLSCALQPGTYWLAYQVSGTNAYADCTALPALYQAAYTYGSFPDTMPAGSYYAPGSSDAPIFFATALCP